METIDSIFYFIVICLVIFANHIIKFNGKEYWYMMLANILFKIASYFVIGYAIFVLLCYFEVIPYIVIANQCK